MAQPYSGQSDAAVMKPRMIPDDELHGRDDSGGPGFKKQIGEFGSGGKVQGAKPSLSVRSSD